jgi:hypothetical protein
MWVCHSCGLAKGTRVPTVATYHFGLCGLCGANDVVTEGRDYGVVDPSSLDPPKRTTMRKLGKQTP